MIRLLIADDHPLVRRGLKELLANTDDIAVAAEACDGLQVLEVVASQAIDVVLLDLNMPARAAWKRSWSSSGSTHHYRS